jgi:hypothetical protein
LKPSTWGGLNKIATDNIKDYTRDAIGAGWQIGKDFNKNLQAKGITDVKLKIDRIFQDIVDGWKQSLTDINSAVFSGDEKSLSILNNLLKDGNSLDREPGKKIDFEKNAKRFIYSQLVPEVWRMQGFFPVFLYTAFPCATPGIGIRQWHNKKKLDEQIFCWGDLQYQLWAVKGKYGCKDQVNPCRMPECNNEVADLPGLKAFRTKVTDFGDINMFDLATNAFQGYENIWHGNHRYNEQDTQNDNTVGTLVNTLEGGSTDISKMPGLVSIPICTWNEIRENWKKGPPKDDPGVWPCNDSGSS